VRTRIPVRTSHLLGTGGRIALIFVLLLPSAWAFASDDPCYMAYWHAEKSSELHACEAAANAGVADAQFGYGLILWSSANRQHDHRAALDWFRKSARQGYQLAQSLLGNFLANKGLEADLRNPVEAYAWRVTVGDQKSAAKLRATLDEREAHEADRLAAEYSAKYGRPRPSASPWLAVAEVFLRIWPELVVLTFLAFVRSRLKRKLLFIFVGTVIAYTGLFLVDLASTSAIVPTLRIRFVGTENPAKVVLPSLCVYALFALTVPPLVVFALSRFLIVRDAEKTS
jgi:hypothetical protein